MIRRKINKALPKAMDAQLADAVEDFTATRTVSGEYDPVSGTTETTTETYTGRWIRGQWEIREIDEQHVLRTDIKRTILKKETDWVPQVDDQVAGMTVVDVSEDPSKSIWVLNLRVVQ